jgi:DNA-binding response OmpR family regulator
LTYADYHRLMTRVLLAEDDASISEPLARALRREGYEVEVREDGPTALDAGMQGGIDLVVLDLGLPGMDGLEVARRLRADGHAIPILILTARADEVDTVVGLDAGADDYVTKPFRLAELLARVRALLRRGASEPQACASTSSRTAPGWARRSSSSRPRSSTSSGSSCATPAGWSPATS